MHQYFITEFSMPGMDCPSEERLIRMKLDALTEITELTFDLPGRTLSVRHEGDPSRILEHLQSLGMGAAVASTRPAGEATERDTREEERSLLWTVLFINFFFFLAELTAGYLAGSMGLLADSLDMLADSLIYSMALLAVGKAASFKSAIARTGGYFQLFLALLGLAETIRRFAGAGESPDYLTMMTVSLFALAGNAACLMLLQRSRSKGVHMRASIIFTSNDVLANAGVILAGGVVWLTGSKYPDLIIGVVVFVLVGRGAFRILKLAGKQ